MNARIPFVLAAAIGQVATARAQTLTVAGLVGASEHRVDVGFEVERSSGLVGGGRISVVFPPRVTLRVTALAGRLERDSANADDRDVADVGFDAGYRALSWLTFVTGVRTRTYTAPIARQRWTSLQLGAEARIPLLDGAIEGVGRFLLLPLVSVSDLDQPELAFTTGAGIDYHVGAVAVGLRYALERYDFAARQGVARREQLSSLRLELSLPLVRF